MLAQRIPGGPQRQAHAHQTPGISHLFNSANSPRLQPGGAQKNYFQNPKLFTGESTMSKTIQTLTPEQGNKLIDYFHVTVAFDKKCLHAERNLLITLLLLDAGLRVGELVQLKVSDVWFDNQPTLSLEIRADTTKTKTERTIPITERTRLAILKYSKSQDHMTFLNPDTFLFSAGAHGAHITTRQVERIIRTAGQTALGIRVHPHMLRHTFATRLMQKANIRVVQALLGHKSLQSTQIYTHPNNQDLKKAIDSME